MFRLNKKNNFGGGNVQDIGDYIKEITECDRVLGIYYLFALILVLILAGNLIQKGSQHKDVAWFGFSMCVFIGLIGMFLILKGKHIKLIAISIINLVIAVLLMFGMIYTNPDAPLTEKFGAHTANILFLIVSITGVVITRNITE
jgi:UDP-N-acetylmuramyl pentapeptide phosphotransferase/UDP-N-acetylglucosamine-1-phosphate transferase